MSITDTIEAINELPDAFEDEDTVIISFGPGTYTSKEIPVASLKDLAAAYTELLAAAKHLVVDVGKGMLASEPESWVEQDRAIDRLEVAINNAMQN